MVSQFLKNLSENERIDLINQLYEIQKGNCFICDEPIDLELQKDSIDIDHVVPLNMKGTDEKCNLALTHSSCNRSKQDSNLHIARILALFKKIQEIAEDKERGADLGDILKYFNGGKHDLAIKIDDDVLRFSLGESNKLYHTQIYIDHLSKMKYCFIELPLEYIHHDSKLNPRSIGSNLSKLLKEFYQKRPQLHITLGWLNSKTGKVNIFDGQHKASAQILLGVKKIPVRIFIDPDLDVLLTANTNAGTTLRQVAFDKSIQRRMGFSLMLDRINRYRKDKNLDPEDENFSELDLVNYFKGEGKEFKSYIGGWIRDSITHHPDNKLREYIEFGGRSAEKPLSYSTIDKTFYSHFISKDLLSTKFNYKAEIGENPRELEIDQIVKLMNIITDELFIDKYDTEIGSSRVEKKIQNDESIPSGHLIAYRMAKEEVIYNWLLLIKQVLLSYFITTGKPVSGDNLFQNKIPDTAWTNISNFIKNLISLPVWLNNSFSSTVFGVKQSMNFWDIIFKTGKTPDEVPILGEPINLIEMLKPR